MAIKKFLALLRGINVGGKNVIKMDSLIKAFEEMQCTNVTTCIQSGNILFCSAKTGKIALAQSIKKNLAKKFNIETRALILNHNDLEKIITGAPAGFGEEPETYRYDIWFLLPPLTADEVIRNTDIKEGVDAIYRGKSAVYTTRLICQMGKSRLIRTNQMPMYQNITIRNWNTGKKLLDLM